MSRGPRLLSVSNLKVAFGPGGSLQAVRGVSFDLEQGKTHCLVGESGSGKSVTSMAIMGLCSARTAKITADRLELNGRDLLSCSRAEMIALRGRDMSMIFQDPMSSLNPALTVGYQISEGLRLHERISGRASRARALEMLQLVRIPDAAHRLSAYPHQLSGGMRQRVMIAMALVCRPKLLIADEPTTALDVTVQAQILWLLQALQRESGTAILFITHDLGVVAEVADDVSVMYAGKIVETGPAQEIFDRPAHGYTVGLLGATPVLHASRTSAGGRLVEIPGSVSRPDEIGVGCSFESRCAHAAASCRVSEPAWMRYGDRHHAACDQVRKIAIPAAQAAIETEVKAS